MSKISCFPFAQWSWQWHLSHQFPQREVGLCAFSMLIILPRGRGLGQTEYIMSQGARTPTCYGQGLEMEWTYLCNGRWVYVSKVRVCADFSPYFHFEESVFWRWWWKLSSIFFFLSILQHSRTLSTASLVSTKSTAAGANVVMSSQCCQSRRHRGCASILVAWISGTCRVSLYKMPLF